MLIEFDKSIERLDREVKDMEKDGQGDSQACWMARGALGATEKLKAFYESQMAGHIKECHGQQQGGPHA